MKSAVLRGRGNDYVKQKHMNCNISKTVNTTVKKRIQVVSIIQHTKNGSVCATINSIRQIMLMIQYLAIR
jgi:hypothetical protein